MFEFNFSDSEYAALNNLSGTYRDNMGGQIAISIYLGCDVWGVELSANSPPDTAEEDQTAITIKP